MNPICPYCQAVSELVTGDAIYPRMKHLHHKYFYRCLPCLAWVGCHPGTKNALGVLANAELRKAKSAAHLAFDPIWKSKKMRRKEAYAWLADKLGKDCGTVHIGMMDLETCRRVVEICKVRP